MWFKTFFEKAKDAYARDKAFRKKLDLLEKQFIEAVETAAKKRICNDHKVVELKRYVRHEVFAEIMAENPAFNVEDFVEYGNALKEMNFHKNFNITVLEHCECLDPLFRKTIKDYDFCRELFMAVKISRMNSMTKKLIASSRFPDDLKVHGCLSCGRVIDERIFFKMYINHAIDLITKAKCVLKAHNDTLDQSGQAVT